jgi:hypothetical protein
VGVGDGVDAREGEEYKEKQCDRKDGYETDKD